MAEIIPSLTREVLKSMTAGEKRFAQRLKELLEDDYLCWFDTPVGKQQRYPDFILLHPSRGLLFLEVKDWKPETIRKINKQEVTLLTLQGQVIKPNPFVQVRQYVHQVINLLQKDKLLQQSKEGYLGNLITPYAWGVVFTNITRKQIEKAIPEEQRTNLLPDHLMIYKDEMTESVDSESFQERLWGMFNYQFEDKLTLPQIDRIRWHLFPEIRIDSPVQENLFDDVEQENNKEQQAVSDNLPDIIRIMDIQQEQLARSLGGGHRVIHGVAGSGKTLILGYRAQMLAQTIGKPILILCFNISLAAKLQSFIVSKNLSEQILIYHFHEWCKTQLKTYHVDVFSGDEPYYQRQVTSVINAVDRKQIPRAQYGAVLIDEGHDFEAQWLKLVVQMIDPETNSLLLLYDDAQSIYQQRNGLGFSLSSVGIQAKGRTSILRLNYRNTREILDFAYHFAHEYLNGSNNSEITDELSLVEPEAAGMSGPKPKVHFLSSWQSEVEQCVKTIKEWHSQGKKWRDMAIIYVKGYQGKVIDQKLRDANIPTLWAATKQYKSAYDPSVDRVTVLTLQSSKGLEFSCVVMVGVGELNSKNLANDGRLLYVGMTRAQSELHICSSSPSVLCDKLALVANI